MTLPFTPKDFESARRTAENQLDFDHLGIRDVAAYNLARAFLALLEARGLPPVLKMDPTVQLHSGVYYNFLNPDPDTIDPLDIAHSLSRKARYNGHTRGSMIYSVAQHCVLAARAAPPLLKFPALLHDGLEYVIGDMVSPLKQLCPDFRLIEERGERAMAIRFNIPYPHPPEIKHIDLRLLATEQRDLMPSNNNHWGMLDGIEPYDVVIEPWTIEQSEYRWLQTFDQLSNNDHL